MDWRAPATRCHAGTPLLALALLALASMPSPALARERGERGVGASVVRILNHAQRGSWYAPWDTTPTRQSSGSGFVVEGGLVMTNAHVVSDARLLLLYVPGDPTPHEARVRQIGHDCDLALLEPIDPELLRGVPALPFGEVPELESSVVTYGYPTGGQRISSTRGVVSRIEMNLYSHSGIDSHLTVQTDAAINPGNSGGPVVQDGRVVGVAFQAATHLENVGFFIPTEVIEHFLRDSEDSVYHGYPELGVTTSNLENPAGRRRAGMRPGESGVHVDFVFPGSSADGFLRPDDVLLEVDGHALANDGTAALGDLRLHFGVLLDRHQAGESVVLRVLRDDERLSLRVPMQVYPPIQRFGEAYDALPRYYVYAGLVFLPLDRAMLATFGEDWSSRAEAHLIYEYFHRYLYEPERLQQEVVVLLRRLDHPVNAQLAYYRNLVVDRVNDRPIRSLEDLIEAIESHRDAYHVFQFGYYDRFGVLDREAADRAHPEILERYGVPWDRRL